MKKFLKDQKGLSLSELLIVIAILSILIGMVSYGYGMISTKPAMQCAKNIQISLEQNRVNTQGKKCGRISFYVADDGVYMKEEFDYTDTAPSFSDGVCIGNGRVKLSANSSEIGSGSGVTFSFSRSDGRLTSGQDNLPLDISIGSKHYSIMIDTLTGKVFLE